MGNQHQTYGSAGISLGWMVLAIFVAFSVYYRGPIMAGWNELNQLLAVVK